MLTSPSLLTLRRATIAVALVALLSSLYMLTYSGRIESGDSLTLFDATGSLAQFDDLRLDLSLWFSPPSFAGIDQNPLKELDVESLHPPLQPILASALFRLAWVLQGIGLVHTVWLFNIFVCAGAAGLLFFYALALGYSERTAVLCALLFGVCTNNWAYSKTFFREPLTMFIMLLAALLIERLRAARYRSPTLLLAIVLSLIGVLMTKTSAVFAFPALLVAALPSREVERRWLLRIVDVGLLVLLLAPVILVYSGVLGLLPSYFSIAGRFGVKPPFMQVALQGYLFSIGGSVWATSPVVLLALPGGWSLYQRGQRRLVVVIVLALIIYAISYGLLTNEQWFGGLSWPPRFFLPLIPFLMIGVLPILDRVTQHPVSRGWVVAVAILVAYGVWVQISAVSLEWGKYPTALPSESNGLLEWGPGLNNLQYLRWVVIPPLWSHEALDFAWVRGGTPLWAVGFGLLGLMSGLALWRYIREDATHQWLALGLPLGFIVVAALGLYGISGDPLYFGSNPALRAMLPLLHSQTRPGDVLLLNSNKYERFFSNYARLDARIVTLTFQPGERPNQQQPPQIVSDNPDALLTPTTSALIYQLAAGRDRLWLLMDAGPFVPWSVRPIERFMAMHYYPIREIQTDPPDPTLRLIEFSTVNAPDPYAFRTPDNLTDLRYGDSIQLIGYELPSGTNYAPDDVLPLSFYWQTDSKLTVDYTVAWFVVDSETNTVVAQGMDSQPGAGFAPSSTWQPGVPVWDNHALRLPASTPLRKYRLWVSLYERAADGSIHRLSVKGQRVAESGSIGVLPTVIEVSPHELSDHG
jgi:hypothetical protein